ncbi:putative phage tail protein [Afifella aestuarii]|uniref:putative phage tail protein n=1 Tax=Afifella aestuarii TaxID=1909496 RepID=UPI0013E3FE18|nr:putative phage tail protein [Afifella aestuarii]
MSTYFVPAGSDFSASDGSAVIEVTCNPDPLGSAPPDNADVLSAPSADDLLSVALAAQPAGAAWRSPDGVAPDTTSRMARFWRAVSAPFADFYARLFGISQESTSVSIVDSLEDWEAEYALPGPCAPFDPAVSARLETLRLTVRGQNYVTPADFTCLVVSMGHSEVVIEEPAPFRCGESRLGSDHRLGNAAMPYEWVIHLDTPFITHFACGTSELGIDRLTDFGRASEVECRVNAVAPAWTRPVFAYALVAD